MKFTARYILGVLGVAWKGAQTGDVNDDLDLINPDTKPKPWPTTYILIKWKTGEVDKKGVEIFPKTWETRTALRAR